MFFSHREKEIYSTWQYNIGHTYAIAKLNVEKAVVTAIFKEQKPYTILIGPE